MVGAFPPPVHGAALVNAAMAVAIERSKGHAVVFDLAASTTRKGPLIRVRRLARAMFELLKFFTCCIRMRPSSLYIGASGGLGQIYEAAFILLARFFSVPVVIHHHSYAYIDNRRLYAKIFTLIAGIRAVHVVLCPEMAAVLKKNYKTVKTTLAISNAIFVENVGTALFSHVEKSVLRTIGFLGNISSDKGIYEFLEVARYLQSRSLEIVIAGPFQDRAVEKTVRLELQTLNYVKYVGPKYGQEKNEFFRGIDVLIFPSKYIHEAEPLTVLEALANGVPVISSDRGCIKQLLPVAVGKVVGEGEDFTNTALGQIDRWLKYPQEFVDSATASRNHFFYLRSDARSRLRKLLSVLRTGRETLKMGNRF